MKNRSDAAGKLSIDVAMMKKYTAEVPEPQRSESVLKR